MGNELPVLRAVHAIGAWLFATWSELVSFANSVAGHPPTLRALILGVVLLLVGLSAFTWLVRGLKYLAGIRAQPHEFTVRVGHAGRVALARLTTDALKTFGLGDARRARIRNSETGRSATVKLDVRSKYQGSFDDQSIELSQTALEKLGLSNDDKAKASLTIRRQPWYTINGLLDRTVRDPDQSTSLTWRIFLLSLVASVIVAEIYFERGLAGQSTMIESRTR